MKRIVLFCLVALTFTACKKKSLTNNCCLSDPFKQEFSGGYILVPNIFTPDGDGHNDFFEPIVTGVTSFSLKIQNTKNKVLFTGEDQAWDGRDNDGNLVRDIVGWTIVVNTTKVEQYTFYGQLCVLVKGNDICPKNFDDCYFSNQFTTVPTFTFDNTLPNYEELCD